MLTSFAATTFTVHTVDGSPPAVIEKVDDLLTEQLLRVLVNGEHYAQTMRCPGRDDWLVRGLLVADGLVRRPEQVISIDLGIEDGVDTARVSLPAELLAGDAMGRIDDVAAVRTRWASPPATELRVNVEAIRELPRALRAQQHAFGVTGASHAVGLFTTEAEPLVVCEDAGRHNAMDKVIGWALVNDRIPAEDRLLFVSGRQSFDLVVKTAMAGIPLLAGVSAPTSLAVSAAIELGITLCGFVRGDRANIYAHPERIQVDAAARRG